MVLFLSQICNEQNINISFIQSTIWSTYCVDLDFISSDCGCWLLRLGEKLVIGIIDTIDDSYS